MALEDALGAIDLPFGGDGFRLLREMADLAFGANTARTSERSATGVTLTASGRSCSTISTGSRGLGYPVEEYGPSEAPTYLAISTYSPIG